MFCHSQKTIGPNTALVAQMLMCAEAQATSRRGHDMPHSASQFQNSMGYGMMAQLQPGAAGAGGGNVLPAFAAHPSQWQFRTFSDPANERVGLTRKRKQEKEPPREFLADKLAYVVTLQAGCRLLSVIFMLCLGVVVIFHV